MVSGEQSAEKTRAELTVLAPPRLPTWQLGGWAADYAGVTTGLPTTRLAIGWNLLA